MVSRRDWLKLAAAGVSFHSMSGWFGALAADTKANPQRKRACILLWMSGGPSQMDTFDLKPGHENGGPFKAIETSVPGIAISEHLPNIAKQMKHAAIIRSMSTKEGDHDRASYLMRTGYLPQGPIHYPTMGSLFSKELHAPDSEMPGFVSIAPANRFGTSAGFLGAQYAPMFVGDGRIITQANQMEKFGPPLRVENLETPKSVAAKQADARLDLLKDLEQRFRTARPDAPVLSHKSAYESAVRLMRAKGGAAFDLEEEPEELRTRYGANQFGQGCLLARRLVERGVPFIEVTLSNVNMNNRFSSWDSHNNNFDMVKDLSGVLDPAWSTLIDDLKQRGLLDTTLVVWMGEFGRTPKIAAERTGRDHFPAAWSTVLMGGGVKGGQVIGKTSADGMTVQERPIPVGDFMATVCGALGVDPTKQNLSNVGRPIRIIDPQAKPVKEALA